MQNYILRLCRRYAYVYALMRRPGTFFPEYESLPQVENLLQKHSKLHLFDAACRVALALYPTSSNAGKLSAMKEHLVDCSAYSSELAQSRQQIVSRNWYAKNTLGFINEDKSCKLNRTICEEICAQLGKKFLLFGKCGKSFESCTIISYMKRACCKKHHPQERLSQNEACASNSEKEVSEE